ncbi:MAG: hypothetical protein RLZZ69_1952 [Cyanobacteriota bacterium]
MPMSIPKQPEENLLACQKSKTKQSQVVPCEESIQTHSKSPRKTARDMPLLPLLLERSIL